MENWICNQCDSSKGSNGITYSTTTKIIYCLEYDDTNIIKCDNDLYPKTWTGASITNSCSYCTSTASNEILVDGECKTSETAITSIENCLVYSSAT